MSDTQQQKALFLQSKQGKFAVGSRSIPKPGKDELLIKVYSAALNPVDHKVQEYGVFVEQYPAVLGEDIAGLVVETGENVRNFAKGDKVFTHGQFSNDRSAFQQFTLGVMDYTAKIPGNLGYDDAATVPLGFDTASTGLYNSNKYGIGLRPPWEEGGLARYAGPIVILGGASSVGSYVIQLAVLSGFTPIITTASPVHEAYLKSLGATHVIDRHLPADVLKAAIRKYSSGHIKYVYDAISLPDTQQIGWSLLGHKGCLVLTLPAVVKEEGGTERRAVQTFGSPHADENKSLCSGSWAILSEWLEKGTIKPNRYEVLPNGLEGIIEGLERMKKGQVSGSKLVAHPQETK
ncbi:chaperonin 10-like protein [Suillus clintonianus]|uniref:chaperonin 10-like protein n=1 Tax=Suillus clintonianus TaxID=1904413 RepID=UPI001B873862|nr:chaperonin 10-like protein [Suillus clintonianus]KAG2145218.1 chaperonin 10-like protein [Suillus clintonianus]